MTLYDVCTVQYETVSLDDKPNGQKEKVPTEYYIDVKNIAICEMQVGKSKMLYFEKEYNGKKINVFLSSYKKGEREVLFVLDNRLSAYTHWVDYYHMGYMDLTAFKKIITGDNLGYYFDDDDIKTDKRIKLLRYVENKKVGALPELLKEDINAAAKRKENAIGVIQKYFPQAKQHE